MKINPPPKGSIIKGGVLIQGGVILQKIPYVKKRIQKYKQILLYVLYFKNNFNRKM